MTNISILKTLGLYWTSNNNSVNKDKKQYIKKKQKEAGLISSTNSDKSEKRKPLEKKKKRKPFEKKKKRNHLK